MAPDINSLPSSPRPDRPSNPPSMPASNTPSRRTSQIMPPPAAPASAARMSPVMLSNEQTGVPLRHPRPLTAAELYLECEKEQEAVVNRLTRELTALRAQSASVASNASHSSTSTSASLLPVDISDPNPTHQLVGATHPTPSRRHRSSSSVSGRSMAAATAHVGGPHATTQLQTSSTAAANQHNTTVSQASTDRALAATGTSLSRQTSISGTSTPARQSIDIPRQHYPLPHRPSISRDQSQATISSTHAQVGTPHPQRLPSPAQSPGVSSAMQHLADTTAYRSEMEIVKAENEALRQRVRALERALRARRRDSANSDAGPAQSQIPSMASPPAHHASSSVAAWAASDGGVGGVARPRERSESQSTTASSRRGLAGAEDEVRLGESASSIGVGRSV